MARLRHLAVVVEEINHHNGRELLGTGHLALGPLQGFDVLSQDMRFFDLEVDEVLILEAPLAVVNFEVAVRPILSECILEAFNFLAVHPSISLIETKLDSRVLNELLLAIDPLAHLLDLERVALGEDLDSLSLLLEVESVFFLDVGLKLEEVLNPLDLGNKISVLVLEPLDFAKVLGLFIAFLGGLVLELSFQELVVLPDGQLIGLDSQIIDGLGVFDLVNGPQFLGHLIHLDVVVGSRVLAAGILVLHLDLLGLPDQPLHLVLEGAEFLFPHHFLLVGFLVDSVQLLQFVFQLSCSLGSRHLTVGVLLEGVGHKGGDALLDLVALLSHVLEVFGESLGRFSFAADQQVVVSKVLAVTVQLMNFRLLILNERLGVAEESFLTGDLRLELGDLVVYIHHFLLLVLQLGREVVLRIVVELGRDLVALLSEGDDLLLTLDQLHSELLHDLVVLHLALLSLRLVQLALHVGVLIGGSLLRQRADAELFLDGLELAVALFHVFVLEVDFGNLVLQVLLGLHRHTGGETSRRLLALEQVVDALQLGIHLEHLLLDQVVLALQLGVLFLQIVNLVCLVRVVLAHRPRFEARSLQSLGSWLSDG
mmetsp:Transcript_20877/g.32224  ORF Transcript_20877/g.32224 Transcript_20877/m.32224 type:complete len:596 (-) Transcript_20877:143-1930(-)